MECRKRWLIGSIDCIYDSNLLETKQGSITCYLAAAAAAAAAKDRNERAAKRNGGNGTAILNGSQETPRSNEGAPGCRLEKDSYALQTMCCRRLSSNHATRRNLDKLPEWQLGQSKSTQVRRQDSQTLPARTLPKLVSPLVSSRETMLFEWWRGAKDQTAERRETSE